MGSEHPVRKPIKIKTWADNGGQLTHYDPSGHALLLCEKCLSDPEQEVVWQAFTIKQGFALCENHWRLLA